MQCPVRHQMCIIRRRSLFILERCGTPASLGACVESVTALYPRSSPAFYGTRMCTDPANQTPQLRSRKCSPQHAGGRADRSVIASLPTPPGTAPPPHWMCWELRAVRESCPKNKRKLHHSVVSRYRMRLPATAATRCGRFRTRDKRAN